MFAPHEMIPVPVCPGCPHCQPRVAAEANVLSAAEESAGWQLLFDGRPLADWKASENQGTFALQGHDPESRVMYRSLKVRVLP